MVLDKQELLEALEFANGKHLHASREDILFTDVVPGEKHRDGGEYGFYTRYSPTDFPGIYVVSTETTCSFDDCGTGYVGIRALTKEDYQRLQEASDRVEEEGSLY